MSSTRRALIVISSFLIGVHLWTNALPAFFPLQHQASELDLAKSQYDVTEANGVYHSDQAFSYKLPDFNPKVLSHSQGVKRIEVDLTNQRIYAYEGNNKIYDFIISSGLYDWTPRGDFRIWIKLKYTKMSGGSQALGTYYYLPNVPYVMYFANEDIPRWRGFGLHGTYWHNDFGRPKSHGCINLRTQDAEQLYYWAEPHLNNKNSIKVAQDNPGTLITIYGKYGG